MTDHALVLVDFVNDIVHPEGKLSGGGYSDFIESNSVSSSVSSLLSHCRSKGYLIVHVRVGFEPNYEDLPSKSPFFGAAKQYNALNSTSWGFEFADFAKPQNGEIILRKRRISAFQATSLDLILRNQAIQTLSLVGCSTDLAVESTARDAHDLDYSVNIVGDCCAAANKGEHSSSLQLLQKIANVVSLSDYANGSG
jgi:ureidoacrylate peracid hydrolase